jgi:hypothetical protein
MLITFIIVEKYILRFEDNFFTRRNLKTNSKKTKKRLCDFLGKTLKI